MKKNYKLLSGFLLLGCLSANLIAQTYCIPAVSIPLNDDEIAYVRFATISNTTQCGVVAPGPGSFAGGYSNFTGSAGVPNIVGSVPAPVCVMGNTYSLAVGMTMCQTGSYNGIIGVFIDYNNNGVLNDAGEMVMSQTFGGAALNPNFTVYNGPNVTIPFTATPGFARLRVWESEVSTQGGPCGSITWGEVEDYVIQIVSPTPCSSTPLPNSVVATTAAICPNSNTPLSLSTTYTVGNIGYQWSYSNVSALGPFTVIPTSTITAALSSPNLSVTSWFQLQAWCGNGGGTITAAVAQVSVSPVITGTIPYFEGFEGILYNNQLPNCSWTSTGGNAQTNVGASSSYRTPRTGNNYASVYGYALNGTNYYYTNGLYMNAGVTYSASVWWTTEIYGYTNFQEISLKYGPNQSTVGLINIATQSVAVSLTYKQLFNTFTVATSGLYYVALKVVSNTSSYANYLSWDDLSITIPCQLNTPSVTVSATSSVICMGQSVNLSASGASNYSWNTGANTYSITDSPTSNMTYIAVGTSTLTNCSSTVTKNITVNPTPVVSIVPSATAVCVGSAVSLVALGATSYTWDNLSYLPFSSVSPLVNTTYTVRGSFGNSNCVGETTQLIVVNPLPNITALNAPPNSCTGQNVNLSASGATTYQWAATTAFLQGSPVAVTPMVTTTYSLTGTDDNGCSKVITVTQVVSACTGINEHAGTISGLSVYPNPNNGDFTIEVVNGLNKTIEIADVTGRVLSSQITTNDKMNVSINNFANGIYYVKVKTNDAVEVLKIVKQ